jgi:hypothetical protein
VATYDAGASIGVNVDNDEDVDNLFIQVRDSLGAFIDEDWYLRLCSDTFDKLRPFREAVRALHPASSPPGSRASSPDDIIIVAPPPCAVSNRAEAPAPVAAATANDDMEVEVIAEVIMRFSSSRVR